MSRYEYQTSYHHKRVRARKTKFMAVLSVLLVLFVVGFVIYDQLRDKIVDQKPETQAVVSSVEGPTNQVFSTAYFQFQADKSWVEVPESNTDHKFVYKSKNGPLVQHQLTIYVGDAPVNEIIGTRVYPVEPSQDGRLSSPSGVSEHCKKAFAEGAKNEPQMTTYLDVNFNCNVGGTNYRVLVGKIGGKPTMPLPRPDGTSALYTILYEDVTAYPSPNKIEAIVTTFQTR